MQIHELKTWPQFYEAVLSGEKTFEIRKDDRGFQKGDKLRLREWCPKKAAEIMVGGKVGDERGYTGNSVEKFVTYVTGWEQKDGFVVMAIGDSSPF